MRARRGLIGVLAAGAMLALPATTAGAGAEWWDGHWHTTNHFGTPSLKLTQDGNTVEGIYKDNGGATKGTIGGELSDHKTVWTGSYHGNDDKGKFRVELQSDNVSFKGWFKSCGSVTCSQKYDWTGEHS